jgi:hypothetical protein
MNIDGEGCIIYQNRVCCSNECESLDEGGNHGNIITEGEYVYCKPIPHSEEHKGEEEEHQYSLNKLHYMSSYNDCGKNKKYWNWKGNRDINNIGNVTFGKPISPDLCNITNENRNFIVFPGAVPNADGSGKTITNGSYLCMGECPTPGTPSPGPPSPGTPSPKQTLHFMSSYNDCGGKKQNYWNWKGNKEYKSIRDNITFGKPISPDLCDITNENRNFIVIPGAVPNADGSGKTETNGSYLCMGECP